MKILVVTPRVDSARAWVGALARGGPGHETAIDAHPLHALVMPVNGSRPDVVVAEPLDASDLDALEALAGGAAAPGGPDWVLVVDEPTPDILMRAMRCGVREVLPAPADAAALGAALGRIAERRAASVHAAGGPVAGEVIGFLSCKGGSGSTFVATNLAHVLAEGGARRVAVLDLNLQFGDAALFLTNQRPLSNVSEVARSIDRLDRALLQSAMLSAGPGVFVLPASDDPAHAADVTAEHVEAIIALARSMFDLVIIDAGRSLNAVTLRALDACQRIYVVMQLTLPFVRDGRRLRDMLDSLGYPAARVHWIVNRYEKGGDITLDDVKRTLGITEVSTLPNQYDVVASSVNQGIPVERLAPGSAITRALRELAAHIRPPVEKSHPRARGWLNGMLGRPARQEGEALR